MTEVKEQFDHIWNHLYPESGEILSDFIQELEQTKAHVVLPEQQPYWYKDTNVYALYVDLFNEDFKGLEARLDYLQDLGIGTLWLLPILDSPMHDAGFDIRKYTRIRPELLNMPDDAPDELLVDAFRHFLDAAHRRGIHVIFDVALNHTSIEHPWFQESRKSTDNPYRDYYIWNKDQDLYKEARIIFKGLCDSNWEKDGEEYFFHRFFEFQPDLNYRNPQVLLAMTRNLIFWLKQGVDGFRADAIPYIWKEQGTSCENLDGTHWIVKWFRAVFDYLRPNTLLLAEACQPPHEVVKYFGSGDECHAGYHFPIMPMIFKALATNDVNPIKDTLGVQVTPPIKNENQWFMFLRLHDELTLEMVSEEDRAIIHGHFCRQPQWDFRVGEGISARLADLLEYNPDKIAMTYSIMLSLPGTPIVYYGDEFGKTNDQAFYQEMFQLTGKKDTRYYVRGRIDWAKAQAALDQKGSFEERVYSSMKLQLNTRKHYKQFSRGSIEWVDLLPVNGSPTNPILAFIREYEGKRLLIVHNLSDQTVKLQPHTIQSLISKEIQGLDASDLLTDSSLKPYDYFWFELD
ncbi:MAG: alpha-glucosidase C-terminal domain-containing protein [Bacteroidales bacterium]|nr:alpha-glucosidase C-terminal domain-containing protein [Bacteroidales bacterium]